MSLTSVRVKGKPVALAGEAPFQATALAPLVGQRFAIDCDDPWVKGKGGAEHAYLDGAREGWLDHPEHMDFLDLGSPVYGLKRMERDLYLHHWRPWLEGAADLRFLDVGAGIGRFTSGLLDRGATVHAADADLESLRRLVWHAAGREGRLDVHWTSVFTLPEVEVDRVVAAEVLCYVPDQERALAEIHRRLRPGGVLLLSVEGRYGWATSQDAPSGGIEAALGGDGVVWIPGDRWVRTFDGPALRATLEGAGFEVLELVPSHWVPDGPLEDVGPESVSFQELLALEERCRVHPVWGPLNRLWLAAARRR
jgi:SAM-dependent methyltransferase